VPGYDVWPKHLPVQINSSSPLQMTSLHKSVNLQYNTLGCWVDGPNDLVTKRLMFQVLFFFHSFLQNSLQKFFRFIFLFFYNYTEIKIKSFECPKSIRNYEKKYYYLEHQTLG
jgi:hypothetical protein